MGGKDLCLEIGSDLKCGERLVDMRLMWDGTPRRANVTLKKRLYHKEARRQACSY
jgi:hypothetical protein